MADIGFYGAGRGLAGAVRDLSQRASDREWEQYKLSVETMRQQNMERLRHLLQLERDKLSHRQAMELGDASHKRTLAGKEEEARLRQKYPTVAEQTGRAKEKREAGKCDEYVPRGGKVYCRRGAEETEVTRPIEKHEIEQAQQGFIAGAMDPYGADSDDYLPGLEREFQSLEGARVPSEAAPPAPPEELTHNEAAFFKQSAAGLFGGNWDPIQQRYSGLTGVQGEKAQAIADYAEQLFVQARRLGRPIRWNSAVSIAAKELFDIDIKSPRGGQGLIGGGMGDTGPLSGGQQSGDVLGLGL